jgi:phosphotransferase system enzyme I (PtsI)
VLERPHEEVPPHRVLTEAQTPSELHRFQQALIQTRHQILEVQEKARAALGSKDASIFDAHLLVLEDPGVLDEVTRLVQQEHVNVEHAYHTVACKFADALAAVGDDYLSERAADMRDVAARLLNNLLGRSAHLDLRHLTEPCVLVAHDLTPSTTAQLDKDKVLGFATDIGSKTSHTAIMARSLRLPAVVGLKDASRTLATGDPVLLDGYNGLVIANPTDQTLFEYGQLERRQADRAVRLFSIKDKPAITLDGVQVTLSANIERAAEAGTLRESGAEGVGLFRSEFLFLNRDTVPTEEEQYESYRQVIVAARPHPVIIRTLDLGGDKFASYLAAPDEANPMLGWRAIRFCLHQPDLFRTQLRAILRASAEGRVRLMYPMISGVEELAQANALLDECKAGLRAAGIPFDEQLEIGVMIEIPSAVMIADALARRVKFFSIGTNDLIQYSLAVDRLNEKIAPLYEPTHPAILRLIAMTVEAGRRHGIWTGVCGEMAGDPVLVPLLLGLGVEELSVVPTVLPAVKHLIRRMKMSEARALAEFALGHDSGAEILARTQAFARQCAPDLFEGRQP